MLSVCPTRQPRVKPWWVMTRARCVSLLRAALLRVAELPAEVDCADLHAAVGAVGLAGCCAPDGVVSDCCHGHPGFGAEQPRHAAGSGAGDALEDTVDPYFVGDGAGGSRPVDHGGGACREVVPAVGDCRRLDQDDYRCRHRCAAVDDRDRHRDAAGEPGGGHDGDGRAGDGHRRRAGRRGRHSEHRLGWNAVDRRSRGLPLPTVTVSPVRVIGPRCTVMVEVASRPSVSRTR
jgi:hypothetical protein